MRKICLTILVSCLLCTPLVSQAQDERFSLRLIAVRTEAEAASLLRQIQTGTTPFEALAKTRSIDPSANAGGDLGSLRVADLKPEVQRAVIGLAPGQISAITAVDGRFLLFQRLTVEEATWIGSHEAGLQAFNQGRYEEAAQSFRQAVQYAEKLAQADYRLEDSLHGLAETYRLQKKYSEAIPLYRRYIAIHWGGPSAPEVLDRLSALLTLAYFRDSQFAEQARMFEESVGRAPLNEELYQAMSGILFKAQLMPEAEALMVRAARLFPESKDVYYYLGQLYRISGKTKKALEVFERLSQMKAPAGIDPALDRLQQSVVYQKIGNICAELQEFDRAMSAYLKALEVMPDSAESRLGMGDLYVRWNQLEEALAEYSRVAAAAPQEAEAQFRVADVNLRLGHFLEAAAAAAKTLAIDPQHMKAQYVLATALVRAGRKEDGARELEEYRKLEVSARAKVNRDREIVVLNRGAAAKLLEDRPDEAIEMFLKLIESYPDAPAHYLNLGTTQSKRGQHKAAIDTFQKMLRLRMVDNFMVYRNLAEEYQLLGDMEASRRHEAVYLQNIDVTLREALEWNLD